LDKGKEGMSTQKRREGQRTEGDIAIQYIAVCGDVGDEDGGAVVCDDCYVGCCGVWKHIDNTACVSIQ